MNMLASLVSRAFFPSQPRVNGRPHVVIQTKTFSIF